MALMTTFWRRYRLQLETLFVFMLAASVRLTSLGVFLVVDEEDRWHWAVDFYRALLAGDLPGTLVGDGYPGIFPVWLETAWLFVASLCRSLSQGHWISEPDVYMLIHQWSRLSNLAWQRFPVVLANTLLVVVIFLYVRMLFGSRVALLAAVFISLDPFYLSDSRVNRAEALLTGLMAISLLAWIAAHRWRDWRHLLASAISGGLAWLTKSQALILLPIFGIISLLWWQRAEDDWRVVLRHWAGTIAGWTFLAAAAFVLLWPATWTVPGATFGLMFDYLTRKVGPEGVKLFFLGQLVLNEDPGLLFYPLTFLLRVTPLTLSGLLLGAWLLIRRRRPVDSWRVLLDDAGGWALLAYACLYAGAMSLGSHKQDRFLMAVFPVCGILAAIAFVRLAEWRGWPAHRVRLMGGVMLIFQLTTALPFHPYYFTYFNPLVGGGRVASRLTRVGWGEGMDKVADYLNTKPDAASLTVAARWQQYTLGFVGKVLPFDQSGQWTQADYVVLYIQQTQRMLDPSPGVLRYFQALRPEHVVRINGIEYAQIYPSPFTRPAQPLVSRIPGQAALFGYRWEDPDLLGTGTMQKLRVIWENQGFIESPLLTVALTDGDVEPAWQSCRIAPGFEAAARTPGEVVESVCDLRQVADTLPPGAFDLRFGLVDGNGRVEAFLFPQGWRSAIKEEEGSWRQAEWLESLNQVAKHQVPSTAMPAEAYYRDQIRLLAYKLSDTVLQPGQPLIITLYWQALSPIEEKYIVFNHLFGLDGMVIGEADEAPFVPTNQWLPGQVVSTAHRISTDPSVPAPALASLDIGLYDANRQALPSTDRQQQPVPTTMTWVKFVPEAWPDQPPPVGDEILFGDGLLLKGHTSLEASVAPGSTFNLQLWWQAMAPVNSNYVVFVHLLDAAGGIVAQGDGVPVNGRYPTSAWEVGESIIDSHLIALPPDLPDGKYRLIVGLYDPIDGIRLPLARQEMDFVVLGQLMVKS
jgi:hypothetical protein